MGLLEGYKQKEAEAVVAAEALASRVSELEAQLAASLQEVADLQSRPPVVVKSDAIQVDLSSVLSAVADLKAQVVSIPAPVVSGGGSDPANWDKLWSILANVMTQTNKFSKFVDAVSSRFGI